MPHPKHTDADEFQKIVDYINQNGGTAYKNPLAASAQSKLGTSQPISIDEASTFSSTMKDMADMKINKANGLRTDAKSIRSSNPARAEYLEAQARQFDYQAAKYHNRIGAANNHLRKQNGLPENPRNITGFQQSTDIIELSGRNPFTGKDASTIRNLHQSALQSSTDDMIDTLVDIARQNPSQAAQIQKALGKEINRLPPNRAGQAIERIENATKGIKGLDKSLATGAVAEAKMLKQAGTASTKWASFKDRMKNVTGINRMTKLSVFMTVGSAVIIGHQGVTITLNNVKATDTLWDYFRNCYYHAAWEGTGIGPAFEQAQREEIERYMKEFEAKQSPSMVKHVTFTLLKTGTYMGRDAIIGMLYLPDTIWEYFTQEKELEAYSAMQNELARVMQQMIKDQREFDQIMSDMKKMGLHDSDIKPYLDCLCAGCGGSLGGYFNPACTSDIGHGPCQCNGPLTIWKTPLPAGNKQAQYDCFNRVTKMRYNEAQVVFDKWRQQMIDENAKSVQPELDAIMQDIASRKAMEDEKTARDISDTFAAIQELLLPHDADTVRAMVGPYLQNYAIKNLETGDIDRAVDNLNRSLNKIGARSSQQKSDMTQLKAQYENWAESWRETKSKKFREVDELIRKKQTQHAKHEIKVLEYKMLKDPARPLPPAIKDPALLALKGRVDELDKQYKQAMQDLWTRVKPFGPDRNHRLAIPILEKALEEWEHPHYVKENLERQIDYHQDQVKRAENKKKLGQHYENNNELTHAVKQYEESLRIQKDSALERDLNNLRRTVQKQGRARELWLEAQQLQQGQHLAEAIKKYKKGLSIWTDPVIQNRVTSLEKFLSDRKKEEAARASHATQSSAPKSTQTAQSNSAAKPSNAGTSTSAVPAAPTANPSSPAHNQPAAQTGTTSSGIKEYAGLSMHRNHFTPGEVIQVRFTAPSDWAKDAWIGIIPSNIPHGDERQNDNHDISYQYLNKRTSGILTFTAPAVGYWDFRLHDTDNKGKEFASVSFRVDSTFARADGNTKPDSPTPKILVPSNVSVAGLAGEWSLTANNFGGKIEFNVAGTSLTGRIWLNHNGFWETLGQIRFDGRTLTFLRPIKGADQSYTGLLNGNEIKGTFTQKNSAGTYNWRMWREQGAAGQASTVPDGWKPVTIGNVRFAVPQSWQHKTMDEPGVEQLYLYWDGSFDAPLHGVSGGITGNYSQEKRDLPSPRSVRLGGVEVLRVDDGPTMNLLFPSISGNRGVALVVFRGPNGSQATIDAVLKTFSVNGQGEPTSSQSGRPEVNFEVGNIYGVENGPTKPTVFTLNAPRVLSLVQNYHWNSGRGATPGTIALREAGGRIYGPWRTEGSPGQGGVPNAYWKARPMILLPAGTYTVIDSDQASWAHNPQSEGRGFTRIETLPPL